MMKIMWKLFPSPLGVISFFTVEENEYDEDGERFRPLSGLSLFLRFMTSIVSAVQNTFPSPLGVISFFTMTEEEQQELQKKSFRPLSGLSLFLLELFIEFSKRNKRFRPLSGLSLFLPLWELYAKTIILFPSPLGVISFFTL